MGAPENSVLLDESDGIYPWFDLYIQNDPNANKALSSILDKAKDKYKNSTQRIVTDRNNNFVLAPEIHYLVLKAPNLTYRFADVRRLSIPTCVIYGVRDPRSVVASMLKLSHIDFVGNQLALLQKVPDLFKEFWAETTILANQDQQPYINYALLWRIEAGLYQQFVDRDLVTYLCRYEELIAATDATCKKITDTLNIPDADLMISHDSIYSVVALEGTDGERLIDKQTLPTWPSKLSNRQARTILSISQSTLPSLGYAEIVASPQIEHSSTICVLGMHRSGTSCLTGCLEDCGLFLGEVFNEAPYNLKGNKESLSLRVINERVLLFNDGSWDNPPQALAWDDQLRSLRDVYLSIYAAHEQWGFKDPRTLLTLPFWLEALPNLYLVASFRHPMAVARSLAQRDGLAIEAGLALWQKYNLKLLEYAERFNFPIVSFDRPVDEYMQAVVAIANRFGLNQIADNEEIPFFEKSLRSRNELSDDLSIPADILSLYEQLCRRTECPGYVTKI